MHPFRAENTAFTLIVPAGGTQRLPFIKNHAHDPWQTMPLIAEDPTPTPRAPHPSVSVQRQLGFAEVAPVKDFRRHVGMAKAVTYRQRGYGHCHQPLTIGRILKNPVTVDWPTQPADPPPTMM